MAGTKITTAPQNLTKLGPARMLRSHTLEFLSGYFWLIFKNVVGWLLMLAAGPVALTFPGPGGLPLFLLGFALVTFPGKRKLTSRVMRGRGLPIEAGIFTFLTAFFAILVTCFGMWLLSNKVFDLLQPIALDPRQKAQTYTATFVWLMVAGLFALGGTWLVMRASLRVMNYVLRGMPFIRRRFRPWARKHGFNILPSRHKKNVSTEPLAVGQSDPNEEILELDEKFHDGVRWLRHTAFGWGKRALYLGITVAIFMKILAPIQAQWPQIRGRIFEISPIRFSVAAGMFAIFLFVFRSLVWRRILISFGHKLPTAAAVRIWSTSELARYFPGAILQVIGRVYLIRPYGVSGSVCSISQVLELSIFLLANLIVAVSCILYFGIKHLEGEARTWMFASTIILPILLVLLHPKVFYGIINRIMHRLGKPAIVQRLRGKMLTAMLAWTAFGLVWQSMAIFIIVQPFLQLKWAWWWMVAGAYCLAWCAGFLAFWSQGGLGVRELVFAGTMKLILPDQIRAMPDITALLAFLSLLLRLWATTGEFILTTIAYALDLRSAFGQHDAPGRVIPQPPPVGPPPAQAKDANLVV